MSQARGQAPHPRRASDAASSSGIALYHPTTFRLGVAALITGVCLHLPMFVQSRTMGYQMHGMDTSPLMVLGMVLDVLGVCLAAYGLLPPRAVRERSRRAAGAPGGSFKALDDARLTRTHWNLLMILGVALVVDVMKPATIAFVVPGMRQEYGISTATVALLPLFALTGTVLGSLAWGVMADRLGRRAVILLASLLFMGTTICGAMPDFRWNLMMCLIMGMSAGGMLPIVYALMAEVVPARQRGWLVVLHGGLGTVGGYLVASGLAALLEPHFGWRALWFANLPTGALLVLLNRWIPESPRFLLSSGRVHEAHEVMAGYGIVPDTRPRPSAAEADLVAPDRPGREHVHLPGALAGLAQLFRMPYLPQTLCVGLYGLGWGLVNWGFITFLPTILAGEGRKVGSVSQLLFLSSTVAIPGTLLVALAYGRWSSKKSMILYALAVVATLLGFGWLGHGAAGHGLVLTLLLMSLLVSTGGVISMLSPYTAEVYPTVLRGTGSGFAAGASKVGGVIAPLLVGVVLTKSHGLALIAPLMAVPMAAAAVMLAFLGRETTGRRLEDLEDLEATEGTEPLAALTGAAVGADPDPARGRS